MKNKVLFFPKYSERGASSRYRIYSYLPFYEKAGIKYDISPLFGDWYISAIYGHKSKIMSAYKVVNEYIKRIWQTLTISSNTIVYIGAELLPFFPSWLERYLKIRGIKYLIEFDDAIFHKYDQNNNIIIRLLYKNKIPKAIASASVVICGSRYLADFAKQWNEKVYIIPTSIDGEKYYAQYKKKQLIVGWIGSPTTSRYCKIVIPAIKKLQQSIDFEFHLVGFDKIRESELEGIKYKILEWDAVKEVDYLNSFSIGIMPLHDTPIARGKCAFKLVQYMAVGIPTVSTPLQSNIDIDKGCGNLFANSTEEWEESLRKLLLDESLRNEIGLKNKKVADEYYTFQANHSKYENILFSLMNDN